MFRASIRITFFFYFNPNFLYHLKDRALQVLPYLAPKPGDSGIHRKCRGPEARRDNLQLSRWQL